MRRLNGGNHCCRTEPKKRIYRNEDSLRDLWDNIKCATMAGVKREKRQKGPEKILEEMTAENFPNIGKET